MRGRVNQAAWNRARDVASKALSGGVYAAVGNATHFHTTGVSPAWRGSLVRVSQVGSHLFYRFGGRSGSRGAFTYAPRPSTDADQPRLIQAAINPVEAARQAGEAVAYSLVLAQEGRAAPEAAAATTNAARPAAQQRSAPAAASQTQPSTPSPAASARAQAAPTARPARPAESPKPEAAASANAV